jgi:hypothetical protein
MLIWTIRATLDNTPFTLLCRPNLRHIAICSRKDIALHFTKPCVKIDCKVLPKLNVTDLAHRVDNVTRSVEIKQLVYGPLNSLNYSELVAPFALGLLDASPDKFIVLVLVPLFLLAIHPD